MKKIILTLIITIVLAVFVQAAGLGITPSIISMDDLVRGNSYDKQYKLLNLEDYEKEMVISASGEAADWFTFKKEGQVFETLTVPADSQTTFVATITIPEDAPNGMYEGYIDASPVKKENISGQQVNLVVRAWYEFEVTGNERIEGTVESISVQDTESGQDLRVNYDFRSTGNVIARPEATVKIFKDDELVDTVSEAGVDTSPGQFKVQEVLWDTENRGTGNFTADVEVFLEGESLEHRSVMFEIFPRGTFTAEGLVGEIEKPEAWVVDQLGKTSVKFFNTGKIDTTAKISGEVYKDGRLVDVVASDEVFIKSGGSGTLTYYYQPTKEGSYTVESKVLFSGKEMPLDDLEIEVVNPEDTQVTTEISSGPNMLVLVLIGVIVFLVAAVFILGFLFMKK